MSISQAIVAVVAAVIGSSLLSLLGFYAFLRYRKAKRKREEEEQNVNDALDRAIVSYIVKEHPGSANATGSPGQGQQMHQQMQERLQDSEPPSPPRSESQPGPGPEPEPSIGPSPAPAPSTGTRQEIGYALTRDQSLRTPRTPKTPSRLHTIVETPTPGNVRRQVSIRSPESTQHSVYGDILARPLEIVPTNSTARSWARPVEEPRGAEEPRRIEEQRRDSNWPLPKSGWI